MKRFSAWMLSLLSCFGLIFILLFSSFHLSLNDDEWFKTEFYRLDTSRKSGYYNSELLEALESARARLAGNREVSSPFSGRELARLDVIEWWIRILRIVFIASIVLCVLFFTVIPLTMRHEWLSLFSRSYTIASGIWFIPLVALMIAMGASFSRLTGFIRVCLKLNGSSLGSNSLLGWVFSDTLLYDLTARSLRIGITLAALLLIFAIIYLIIRAHRQRSPMLIKRHTTNMQEQEEAITENILSETLKKTDADRR